MSDKSPSVPGSIDDPILRAVFAAFTTEPLTGVAILDETGRVLYGNPQISRMLRGPGAHPDQAVGRMIGELYPEGFANERIANIRHVFETGKPLLVRLIWRGYQLYSWILPIDDAASEPGAEAATGASPRRVLIIARRSGSDGHPLELVQEPVEQVDAELIDLGPLDVLSPRELEVLTLIGQGLSAAEIAKTLHRSVKTINTHRENIGKKLRLDDRVKLASIAQRAGLRLADAQRDRVDRS